MNCPLPLAGPSQKGLTANNECLHFKPRQQSARDLAVVKATPRNKKMLENRPEDALVLLVETVEIV